MPPRRGLLQSSMASWVSDFGTPDAPSAPWISLLMASLNMKLLFLTNQRDHQRRLRDGVDFAPHPAGLARK